MILVLVGVALASDLRSEWRHSLIGADGPAAQVLRALGAGAKSRPHSHGALMERRFWPFTSEKPAAADPVTPNASAPVPMAAPDLPVAPPAPPALPPPPAKLTVVIQGYSPRRIANYPKLWTAYGSYDRAVDKIIFIWNNVESPPPPIPNNTAVPIQFIQATANLMTNRYNVLQYLNTEAVMIVDDDVVLNRNLVHCMLHEWRMNKARLVGLDERSVTDKGDYMNGPIDGKHSMVLGKTMLFSSQYLTPFFSDPGLVRVAAHECDDISMNAFISKQSGLSPLIVLQDPTHIRNLLPDVDGASITTHNWYNKRSDCVHLMREYFGMSVFKASKDVKLCA